MRAFVRACRYFAVVAVVPRLFLVGFLIIGGVAVGSALAGPVSTADVLSPLLTLQMFAAASGFDLPARRGHFDLLLTSGVPRWHVAGAHALMSIAPGLAAWLAASAILAWCGTPGAWAPGNIAAFASVSGTAWSTAVPTSRARASVGWVVLMTAPRVAAPMLPTRLLGQALAERTLDGPTGTALLWVGLAAVATTLAVRHATRAAVPLEVSQ